MSLNLAQERKLSRPLTEAQAMLALLNDGSETIESIRRTIGTETKYRRDVSIAFGVLVARHYRNPKITITPELRGGVLRLLQQNWTQAKVARRFGLSATMVWKIQKRFNAAYQKTGRGRRISPEDAEGMKAMLRNGAKPIEVRRKYRVCAETVREVRVAIGDMRNLCSHARKLTPEQREEIRQEFAHRTLMWKELAAKYGVCIRTLENIKKRHLPCDRAG
jgi:hypothetical protein